MMYLLRFFNGVERLWDVLFMVSVLASIDLLMLAVTSLIFLRKSTEGYRQAGVTLTLR